MEGTELSGRLLRWGIAPARACVGLGTHRYSVQLRLGSIPGSCGQGRAPHAQWTWYLIQGHSLCEM
jgi:hypothetical protein